ncbi:hypothetical protein NECAME_03957 [Necator americanus]|uniref:Uncharacterized protein n=1 Tax=Necator americanus TaxID=51031 RepID=W2SY01_NECAM|nr:hypothetical protein NECAME_03957 [Necator americanus]ETN74644.1 hypothetical protein NECAME_03957 [Necator americanus]
MVDDAWGCHETERKLELNGAELETSKSATKPSPSSPIGRGPTKIQTLRTSKYAAYRITTNERRKCNEKSRRVFLYRLSAKPCELGREFLVPCGSCCCTLAYQLKSLKRQASLGGFKTLSLLRAVVKVFDKPAKKPRKMEAEDLNRVKFNAAGPLIMDQGLQGPVPVSHRLPMHRLKIFIEKAYRWGSEPIFPGIPFGPGKPGFPGFPIGPGGPGTPIPLKVAFAPTGPGGPIGPGGPVGPGSPMLRIPDAPGSPGGPGFPGSPGGPISPGGPGGPGKPCVRPPTFSPGFPSIPGAPTGPSGPGGPGGPGGHLMHPPNPRVALTVTPS